MAISRVTRRPVFLFLLTVGLLGGALLLTSAPAPPYSQHDKAFYASEAQINFVRPGLVTEVVGAEILADNSVRARVKFSDPRGLPLDREGIVTPGPISCSFILARIPTGQTQYVAYTTRVQTSPITGVSATQASGESNGTWAKIADGEYTYTFRAKLPANFDRTATHTIGAYSSRNLSEFDFPTSYDDSVLNWVPSGAALTNVRDVIKTQSCNNCHDQLGLHGGSRRTMEVCVLCHTPQTVDPDTGNTVDMPVMTHKIHMGVDLPSVQAGKPYIIIGHNQSVHDYSEVGFPADARRCVKCHEQNTGAAQAKNYYKANRAACGACHDDVNFATGDNHIPMPIYDDKQCTQCHIPKGEIEFDVSIEGAHTIPNESPSLPGVKFKLLEIHDKAPGQKPLVVFVVENNKGGPVVAATMSRLRLYLTGPNTDYTWYVMDDVRKADGNGYGVYWWRMSQPIPANAKGSWTIAIEGRNDVTLNPGTTRSVSARDIGKNVQMYFSVDGTEVAPRREAASIAKCNACHANLGLHGGARNTVQQCVICHNPNATDGEHSSIELGNMVHKIHSGKDLEFGYKIEDASFDHIGYPGDRRNCSGCHINNGEQLPLNKGQLAVVHPGGFINPAGRETTACLGCHDSKAAAAHAKTNTDPSIGEACAACHGADAVYSVNRVHAR